MSVTSTWTQVINSGWRTYFFADPWGEAPDDSDAGAGAAMVNGFLGMRNPWASTVITGTKYGPVRLTVALLDERPALDYGWTEIIEVEWRSRSGDLEFREWGGEPIHTLEEFLLPPGRWRLRAHARGRDEAHARGWDPWLTEEPVEEHLLQFWRGPSFGDLVLTQDDFGKSMRGELSP